MAADDAPPAPSQRVENLTVFMIVHNERANLPRCLDSCAFAGRVVVVDSGSTDGSVEYARARGAYVERHTDWPGFGAQKNRALDLCETPWVLNIDADEWIDEALREEITRIVRGEIPGAPAAAYRVKRRCYFDGRLIKCCRWWPHPVVRLFQRSRGRYRDQRVHESLAIDGDVASMEAPLNHEPYTDYLHLVRKNIAYARAGAEQMVRDGRRVRGSQVLSRGVLRFLRDMFVKGGIFYGATGFAIAAAQGFGVHAKYTMVWFDQRRVARGKPSRLRPSEVPPAQEYD